VEEESKRCLQSLFEGVADPRIDRTKRHHVLDLILIAIVAVLCGTEGWVDIEA